MTDFCHMNWFKYSFVTEQWFNLCCWISWVKFVYGLMSNWLSFILPSNLNFVFLIYPLSFHHILFFLFTIFKWLLPSFLKSQNFSPNSSLIPTLLFHSFLCFLFDFPIPNIVIQFDSLFPSWHLNFVSNDHHWLPHCQIQWTENFNIWHYWLVFSS